MKPKHLFKALYFLLPFLMVVNFANSQCGAGYSEAKVNWDNLDFLVLSGSYTPFVSSALVQNQKFVLGKNRMTFVHNYNSSNSLSENNAHSGETGTFGTNADVQFIGNGQITLNFDSPVQNLRFSLYDIDYGQQAAFSAVNGVTPVNVNLAILTGSILTITNNNTTTARVDAAATTAVGNNSNTGAVNVTVAGTVTSITITISNTGTKTNGPPSGQEDGSFWVSDIIACVTGTFPTNYYQVSRPFTGQPKYILTVVDNKVYYTNPDNGVSKFLFSDPGHTNINSLAYDPYNRIVYYTYSLTATPQNERTIRKYNVNTDVISILNNDIYSNLNVPTYENGVTSGAAAFYDGAYYIGIEGYNSGTATGRKSLVWRIDFDSSLNPTQATQVYGSDADNGTSTIHDWSDIGINNGILYDFDGAASNADIYHYNLITGDTVRFAPGSVPRQVGIDWNGQVYNVSNAVEMYNYNGTMGTPFVISSTPAVPPAGSWGDAGEAFRPLLDFGDAPATYDPDPLSPAVHDRDTSLRIGNTWDREWLKRGVTGVEDIDDGLAFTPIYAKMTGQYYTSVRVWNNTGANATLCAWFDYNGNGVFEASEGLAPIAVTSSNTYRNFNLQWTGIPPTLVNGTYTYLRIRITSSANGMTAANPTGYYDNGETEDYRVIVDDYPLKISLLDFKAVVKSKNDIELDWTTTDEVNFMGFELQRSTDKINWVIIDTVYAKSNGQPQVNIYLYHDLKPLIGTSYYRLRLVNSDGKYKFSEVRKVTIEQTINLINLYPVPAKEKVTLDIFSSKQVDITIRLNDLSGKLYMSKSYSLTKGKNSVELLLTGFLNTGFYIITIQAENELINKRLIIANNK